MKEMEVHSMKTLVKQIRGVSYKPEDLHSGPDSSSIMLLRANNIDDGRINFEDVIYVDKARVAQEQLLKKGDILICASSGSKSLVGKAATFDFEEEIKATFGAFCKVVRPNDADNREYISMYFQSPYYRRAISSAAIGANINNIRNEHIDALKIHWSSDEKRKSAVTILGKIDKIIRSGKEELMLLDDLIKARFVEMFVDPVSNPKGWQMVELGTLAEVGSSKRIFEKEYVPEGVPFYRTKEIVELSKGNQISTELFISRERFEEIKRQYGVPKAGDLLISAVGTIGVIWIVDGKNDFYFKDGNLIRVDGSDKFDSTYMKAVLENQISEYKKQMSSGTAYAALTISGLTKMRVYDVPMALQKEFASFVAQVDKSKVVVQKALDEAQILFDSLMQQYFG